MNEKAEEMVERAKRTWEAVRTVIRSPRHFGVFLSSGLGFFLLFMFAMQDLTVSSTYSTSFNVASDLSVMFEKRSTFQYEPIARAEIGYFTFLLSPFNIGLGLLLGVLTGLNMMFSYTAWRQPKVCSVSKSSGIVSSIPAVLAGSACCAPIILIILGVQITSALLAFFSILIPLALFLLVFNLVLSAEKVRLEQFKERFVKK